MHRLLRSFLLCLVALVGAACESVPPANLSGADFSSIARERVRADGLVVTVAPGAVGRRAYGSGTPAYSMPYVLGDVDRRYARAVAENAFVDATFRDAGGELRAPVLRLDSLAHGLFARSGGSIPDATDEVTTRWTLLDSGGGVIARYVFVGAHTAATGLGGRRTHFAKAQARGLAAMELMYRNTLAGLAAAREDFVRLRPP